MSLDCKSRLSVYSTCPSEHAEQLSTDLNYQLSTVNYQLTSFHLQLLPHKPTFQFLFQNSKHP